MVSNLRCFSNTAKTNDASCIAKLCPGQDLPPAENAKNAFRFAAFIVQLHPPLPPVFVFGWLSFEEHSRSFHLLLLLASWDAHVFSTSITHRSGRNSCGRSKYLSSRWIFCIGMKTPHFSGNVKFPLKGIGFVVKRDVNVLHYIGECTGGK